MKIIAIVGPTATGKSDLAVEVAHQLGGSESAEIINADAYQLYRGMDIGTAKISQSEQQGIQHHLFDVLTPLQDSSVATYQEQSRSVLRSIEERGKRAIVVGGSGLYVRAMLDDMNFPGTDPAVRAELEERAERVGTRTMFNELREKDPAASDSIGPHNVRRIIRALEVIALTGAPYSANLPKQEYVHDTITLGLDFDRAMLDARVEQRVHKMIELGLVEEVRSLNEQGLGVTARRAVGYAEILEYLAGEITLVEAAEQIIANTRRLTRKQMGWFGRDPRIQWLQGDSKNLVEEAIAVISDADQGMVPVASSGPVRRSLGS